VTETIETSIKSAAAPAVAPAATPTAAPKARRPLPAAITVTQAAVERVQALLDKRGKPSFGVRVGVRTRGCSGLS